MNNEEVKIVAEDLSYLKDEWNNNPTEQAIRRGSVILRRLLVERDFSKAWRTVGFEKEPKVTALNLNKKLEGLNLSSIIVATAGGANYRGMTVSALHMASSRDGMFLQGHDPTTPRDNVEIKEELFLSSFIESDCSFANGQFINRREVIKYMANVRGGAHLKLSGELRQENEALVHKISALEERINFHQMDGLFFELLSIGQCLSLSPDVARFLSKLK